MPGEDAKPEDVAAFHKALGVPEDPNGYELDKVELPEGMTFDTERAAAMAPILQKMGVTPAAAKALVEADAAYQAQRQTAIESEFSAEIEKGRGELDQEWVKAGKSVAEQEAAGRTAWKAFTDPKFYDTLQGHADG